MPVEQAGTKGAKRTPASNGDYGNEAKVRALFDRCIADAKGNKPRMERDRQDIFNLMLYRGGEDNHWSIFNTTTNQYEPRPTSGEGAIPGWVKRCVTNKYAKKIDGVVAILNQSSAAKSFSPSTDDDADRATAEVCEDADPVLLEEIGYEALKRRLNQLVTLTDKAAVVYWFDNDEKYGTYPVPLMQCLDCGEVMTPMETGGTALDDLDGGEPPASPDGDPDDMGGPPDADADDLGGGGPQGPAQACRSCGSPNVMPAQDPATGIPIGVDYPRGKLCADLWTSYEFSIPSSAKIADADQVEWVLGHAQMSIDAACRAWPKYARKIREQGAVQQRVTPLTRQYAEQMRQLSSPNAARFNRGGDAHDHTLTVYRLQHDAIEDDEVDFPDGLHAVMLGDLIVEIGPLPLEDEHGYRKKSILLRQYADTPNTPFGKPVADDLGPVQVQRNLRETIIYITDMYHALPTVFMPAGVELIDEWLNQPGQMVRYRSSDPSAKPTLQHGISAPEGLYKSIEACDAALDEISGLNAVLQGERPEGDPTLGEVNMLAERGMAAFRTPLDHQIAFEKKQTLLLLNLARKTAWAPRFRKVEGETGGWKVTQFTAADLSGRVDISIDPLSAWPRSPSMQLVKLQKGLELGAVPPPATDPEVATKVLQMLDLMELKPSLDTDRDQVSRLLDRWKHAQSPADIQPPDLDTINPQIHLVLIKQFVKTEPFEQLRHDQPQIAQAIVGYIKQLQQGIQPPPPKTPEAKVSLSLKGEDILNPEIADALQKLGVPIVVSSQEPPQSPLSHMVNGGALKPAGGKPQSPLAALVKGGALQPAGAAGAAKDAASRASGASVDALLHAGALRPAPPKGGPEGVH
jgi:hypothetical protein